jgi:hypothetical protein
MRQAKGRLLSVSNPAVYLENSDRRRVFERVVKERRWFVAHTRDTNGGRVYERIQSTSPCEGVAEGGFSRMSDPAVGLYEKH